MIDCVTCRSAIGCSCFFFLVDVLSNIGYYTYSVTSIVDWRKFIKQTILVVCCLE